MARRNVGIPLGTCRTPPCCSRGFPQEIVAYLEGKMSVVVETRWDEKAGLRRDAVGSQVIDVLLAQEIKETGNEEG